MVRQESRQGVFDFLDAVPSPTPVQEKSSLETQSLSPKRAARLRRIARNGELASVVLGRLVADIIADLPNRFQGQERSNDLISDATDDYHRAFSKAELLATVNASHALKLLETHGATIRFSRQCNPPKVQDSPPEEPLTLAEIFSRNAEDTDPEAEDIDPDEENHQKNIGNL
jgi:hypothetical protein